MINFEDKDLWDAYAKGTLDKKIKIAFDEKCATDEVFNKALNKHLMVIKSIQKRNFEDMLGQIETTLEEEGFFETEVDEPSIERAIGRTNFEDMLAGIDQELENEGFFDAIDSTPEPSKKTGTKIINFRILGGIAAAFIIALIGVYTLLRPTGINGTTLYATYYDLPESVVDRINEVISGNGAAADKMAYNALKPIMEMYDRRAYDEMVPDLEDWLNTHQTVLNPRMHLYLGIGYLESKQPEKAKKHFKLARQTSQKKLQEEAVWYLALTALQQEDMDTAKTYLILLRNNKTYQDRIEKILAEGAF